MKSKIKIYHQAKVAEELDKICSENPNRFWNILKKTFPGKTRNLENDFSSVVTPDGIVLHGTDITLETWRKAYEKLGNLNPVNSYNEAFKLKV